VKLTIYLEEGCPGCERARQIADEVKRRHGAIDVEVVDLAEVMGIPEAIIAVPAYVLDDRLVYLGNPRLTEMSALIEGGLAVEERFERAEKT
jgi:hypothetical protein